MQEYRGIKLADSVKLYRKDGDYNERVKKGLDRLINMISEKRHKICSEFVNNKVKILIDFNCSHEPHLMYPQDYVKGGYCPKCRGLCPIKAKEDFLKMTTKQGHKVCSEYIGNDEKILINFNCGHEPHWTTPHYYKNGNNCPSCKEVSKKQAKKNLQLLIEENNHHLLSDYKNCRTKVLIDFKCGHEPHWVLPNCYKRGQGCPSCKESRGEKIISDFLNCSRITYVSQYKFPQQLKRYDFLLPYENLIVEVHGKQHYEFTDRFHRTHEDFLQEQKNDKLKEEYARSLGYEYMIIDYREHNPQLALERFKKQFKEFKERN